VRLTKFTHACVRLEADGRALVIDPGEFSEEAALDGVRTVLVTHEHFDHIDYGWLTRVAQADPEFRIYGPAPVTAQLTSLGEAAVTVSTGDTFTAGGFAVQAVGGDHAEIYEGLPGCPNLGYVIDDTVYHPGDALFVPDARIDTLLVPATAPWLKLAEALDFVRAVKPRRAFPIHDAMLSTIGQKSVEGWMSAKANTDYAWLSPGDSV